MFQVFKLAPDWDKLLCYQKNSPYEHMTAVLSPSKHLHDTSRGSCLMTCERGILTIIDSFYNCVWLILNDIIVGWAIGSFIRENASAIAAVCGFWLRVSLQPRPFPPIHECTLFCRDSSLRTFKKHLRGSIAGLQV